MAKGSKVGGKGKSKSKGKRTGPTSADRVIKTRSMDAILGIQELEMTEDEQGAGEERTCRESTLAPRTGICTNVEDWISASKQAMQDVNMGKAVPSPILQSNYTNVTSSGAKEKAVTGKGVIDQKRTSGVKIDVEDIAEEVNFWQSSLVCYVLGANPPIRILEGFVRRLWKDQVDKVRILSSGIFIIRFLSMEVRDRILEGGYLFFGNKPLIMKAWNPVDDFSKEDIDSVPTWVHLGGLDINYWGDRSLFKIVGQIGKPIQVDSITKNRDRLAYPRILIEVTMTQDFPSRISFLNEFDQEVDIFVEYEWKPTVCTNCSGLGHEAQVCRKSKIVKQEWVPKQKVSSPIVSKVNVDADGFQSVTKGIKIQESNAIQTSVNNKFFLLKGDPEMELLQRRNTVREGGGPFVLDG
ncbi:uncharacterized protein LOC133780045 [Humulus lupulus]|uniref:uncharacterized protein LOC133780045 n=1 Tax=Humulus lupulus TaxID=3486 RepID=UPI002B41692C|nr:uncharacterized protein LOC133780045 [Humulus lupulus]